MIERGSLEDILIRDRAEVLHMLLTEYDEKKHMRDIYKEGYDDGERAGYDKGERAGYDKGKRAGYDKGERDGCELTKKIYKAYIKGESVEVIAKECNIPVSQVEKILQ